MMSEEEIHSYMDEFLTPEVVQKGLDNTMLIYNMVQEYTLFANLEIPYEPDDLTEPDLGLSKKYFKDIPMLEWFFNSDYNADRHLVREIVKRLEKDSDELANKETYDAIQTCLESIKASSEANNAHWSAYLLQTRDLVNACWACGSLVGPSRGSGLGFILLYILGITQVNPLREDVPCYHWRFLNPKRVSPLDIDVDFENAYRDDVIHYLQRKYCGDDQRAGNRRVMKVQTLSTMKAKVAIQTACRGLSYPPEIGQMLSSHIGQERGIQFTLKQCFYGDEENNLRPDKEFVNLMTNEYPDVWEVAQNIEGLVSGVGSHAGGVVLSATDVVDHAALMKTTSGDIITQFDLHADEKVSLIKWDLLSIDALQKEHVCMNLLMEDGRLEWQGDLKSTYEKYLGVYRIERDNPEIWKMLNEHKVMSFFQMEKQTGYQAVAIGKPESLVDLSALNSVMRLMAPSPRAETPLERFGRYKKDITLWYKEMDDYGLTKHEQEVVCKYAKKSYGLLPNQEDFMMAVQDPEIGGFDLLWADKLRKSIAKKNPKAYVELQQEFYKNIEEKHLSSKLCHYVWDVLISMNRGYGFNSAHTLAYSIVGLQEANLAYHYPVIYWNTANLISDSGGEDGNTNYGKISKAIGNIKKEGVTVALPDVNRVRFGFHPDVEKNEIVYGLKPIQGIGTSIAKAIIDNQTYSSMWDFYEKMQKYKSESKENKFGDTAMISLIKARCFDNLEKKDRRAIMEDFIRFISSPVKSLNISNIEDLANLDLLTENQKKFELRLYRFRNYVFQKKFFYKQIGKSASTAYYILENKFAWPFFEKYFLNDMIDKKDYDWSDEGQRVVKRGSLDRVFNKLMADFKDDILSDPKMLVAVNEAKFKAVWDEKASGSLSKWEMDSLCMYYHEHELAHVNKEKYSIIPFEEQPEEPEVAYKYYWHDQEKARFVLRRICGTVLDKDTNRNTVTLLTPDGVCDIKFYKGQFNFYNRQISQINEDGTKTVLEKSWFQRGTKLLVTGFRRGENFIPRQYKDSLYKHSVQLIKGIDDNGDLEMISDRIDVERVDDEC